MLVATASRERVEAVAANLAAAVLAEAFLDRVSVDAVDPVLTFSAPVSVPESNALEISIAAPALLPSMSSWGLVALGASLLVAASRVVSRGKVVAS